MNPGVLDLQHHPKWLRPFQLLENQIFSYPKGSSIDHEVTGGAGAAWKSSLEASQGQETAREDQGRSGEAQGSESRLPSSSEDGR